MSDVRAIDPTATAAAFAHALAAGDREALRGLLAADVALRAVTPSRSWAVDGADEVLDTVLGVWFGGERRVDGIEALTTGALGGVVHVGYRFRATTPAGPAVVEQQAYLDVTGGTITGVRLVCSGYHALVG